MMRKLGSNFWPWWKSPQAVHTLNLLFLVAGLLIMCWSSPFTKISELGFKLRHIERRVPSRTVEVTQGERTFLMCSIISLWWFKAPYCLNFCHDYNWDSLRFFAPILWILDATLMPHVPLLSGYWKNESLSTLHALHMKSTWFRKVSLYCIFTTWFIVMIPWNYHLNFVKTKLGCFIWSCQ